MALNQFGQYVYTLFPTIGSFSSGPALRGSGSPEGVVTADVTGGATYFYWDYTNDILYSKDSGAGNTGWVVVSSGGGGSVPLFGSGSPEGVTTSTVGTHYWDTTNKVDYVKDSGSGNTGWIVETALEVP